MHNLSSDNVMFNHSLQKRIRPIMKTQINDRKWSPVLPQKGRRHPTQKEVLFCWLLFLSSSSASPLGSSSRYFLILVIYSIYSSRCFLICSMLTSHIFFSFVRVLRSCSSTSISQRRRSHFVTGNFYLRIL